MSNDKLAPTSPAARVEGDIAQLKIDMAYLKGSALEGLLHRKIRRMVCGALALRRSHLVQSPMREPDQDFLDRVEDALDANLITEEQHARIEATDFILQARRREDGAAVWVAVEASITANAKDVQRARATANALRTVFEVEALPVAVGHSVGAPDVEHAKASGVRYLVAAFPSPPEV